MRIRVSMFLILIGLPVLMGHRPIRKEMDPINLVQVWIINRAYNSSSLPRLEGFRPRFSDTVRVDGQTVAYSLKYQAKKAEAWSLTCDLDVDQYREFRLQRLHFTRQAKESDSVLIRMVRRVRQELASLAWKEDHPDSVTFRWEWIPRTTHQLILRRIGNRVEMVVAPRT